MGFSEYPSSSQENWDAWLKSVLESLVGVPKLESGSDDPTVATVTISSSGVIKVHITTNDERLEELIGALRESDIRHTVEVHEEDKNA